MCQSRGRVGVPVTGSCGCASHGVVWVCQSRGRVGVPVTGSCWCASHGVVSGPVLVSGWASPCIRLGQSLYEGHKVPIVSGLGGVIVSGPGLVPGPGGGVLVTRKKRLHIGEG